MNSLVDKKHNTIIGQKIFIGDDIKVELLSIRGGQVSLGIIAPKDFNIGREEIYTSEKDQKSG